MTYKIKNIFKFLVSILFLIIPGSIFIYISYLYGICSHNVSNIKYLGLIRIISYLIITYGFLIIIKEYTNLIISIILDTLISILITTIFIINSYIIVLYYEIILPNCNNMSLITFSKIFYIYYMIIMTVYILLSSLIYSVFGTYVKYKKQQMYNLISNYADNLDYNYVDDSDKYCFYYNK